MTAAELRVVRAARRAALALIDRDAGIRELFAAGYSLRQVAELACLSHQAIAKIVAR